MGFLTKTQPACGMAGESLEEILIELARFGQPKVSMMDSGWHSWIKMHVTAVGATVEVKSDFGMDTPIAAAKQCRERVIQTVRDLGGKA